MSVEYIRKVGFGCVKLSSCRTERESLRILETAYACGVRWFDTAPLYGQGFSEKLLGSFIAKLSNEEKKQIQVITKFGLGPGKSNCLNPKIALPLNFLRKRFNRQTSEREAVGPPVFVPLTKRPISKDLIKTQLESSLNRLRMDEIHGYLGHELVPSFIDEDGLEYLLEKKREGVIQKLGIGISLNDLLCRKNESFDSFDLIQYDAHDEKTIAEAFRLFPHRDHIQHSIFKIRMQHDSPSKEMNPLQIHLNTFPKSRVLFSSSNPEHIRMNLSWD